MMTRQSLDNSIRYGKCVKPLNDVEMLIYA